MTDEALYAFVAEHLNDDIARLFFAYKSRDIGIDIREAVTQIECRRKTSAKLPHFNAFKRFYYPSLLAAEQSSNEAVAAYHAFLVPCGAVVADLTAGLGIDAMTIARKAVHADMYELNPVTNSALRHNCGVLGLTNTTVLMPGDSIEMLAASGREYDVIFIDPARRDAGNNRTYALQDCSPDVTANLPLLLRHCNRLMIKASPMLDITQTARELPGVAEIHVVAWRGECKEVLAIVDRSIEAKLPKLFAVNIDAEGKAAVYEASLTATKPVGDAPAPAPGMYLYEPNAAVMKLGRYADLTVRFPELLKCSANTEVYLSGTLYSDFPGRVMTVSDVAALNDKRLRALAGTKSNVVCRNFPMSAAALKKRLKLTDGGDTFTYGITVGSKHLILRASCRIQFEVQNWS